MAFCNSYDSARTDGNIGVRLAIRLLEGSLGETAELFKH